MKKIINKKPIAILLATYNAGKYLSEQIESILHQTLKDKWTLYIQDDGSKDDTISIIQEYEKNYPDKIMHIDLGLSRQGCCGNFMTLLNVIESEYYMFCDQDDVWLPEKIKCSIEAITHYLQLNPNSPALVHTDRTFVDEKLNPIQSSEWNPGKRGGDIIKKINQLHNKNILSIYNICAGNTMLFNHKVKELCFPYINIRVHDSIVAMAIANASSDCDNIIALPIPTVLYRIHSGQTCGVKKQSIFSKIFHLFDTIDRNLKGFHIWKLYGKHPFPYSFQI